MRAGLVAAIVVGLGGTASAQVPVPGASGPNPGQAATDRILDQTKPAPVATPEASPRPARDVGSPDDMRALLEAMRETAKASRESVDYGRVVPDILTQILAKLDKVEDKLDRIDSALRQGTRRR